MVTDHELNTHLADRRLHRPADFPGTRAPVVPPVPREEVERPVGKDRTTDRTIATVGLAKHPAPLDIAATLEDVASAIRKYGLDAIDLVSVLAARGYSASTIGDGGSRGTDSTSNPERNAMALEDRWWNADVHYHGDLAALWKLASKVKDRTHEILRHAQDIDPSPAGTGECRACARFCKPDKDRPGYRIVSGLCPTCYRAWRRYVTEGGELIRIDWISRRRESYTERDGTGAVVRIHTPEPDHDIDLSTEHPEAC